MSLKQIINNLTHHQFSLGGPTPYVPVTCANEDDEETKNPSPDASTEKKRARVLCSYDAKDHTELNLTSNEVIFVNECKPRRGDYMYGKQGVLKGLVPRAFLEILDDNADSSDADSY